jgi:hypothetical protein
MSILLTEGVHGFNVLERRGVGGSVAQFERPRPDQIVSEIGAEDAMVAALASHMRAKGNVSWSECREKIRDYLAPVLRAPRATIDAGLFPTSRAERTHREWTRAAAIFFLMFSVFLAGLMWLGTAHSVPMYGVLLLLVPLASGAAGALIRQALIYEFDGAIAGAEKRGSLYSSVLFGASAGFTSAVFFFFSQYASNDAFREMATPLPHGLRLLALFELVLGLAAGLTFEHVLKGLMSLGGSGSKSQDPFDLK